jgi:hypothetical protein
MAAVIYYIGGSAAAYWFGSNVLLRSANASIDWLLNTHASPEIGETHTVNSIHAMLRVYTHLKSTHPAFEAMCEVRDGLRDLQIAIERTRLKYEAHKGGYISRFRTFDATPDNVLIDKKSKDLMERLNLFTNLMKLPPREDPPSSVDESEPDTSGDCYDFFTMTGPLPPSPGF